MQRDLNPGTTTSSTLRSRQVDYTTSGLPHCSLLLLLALTPCFVESTHTPELNRTLKYTPAPTPTCNTPHLLLPLKSLLPSGGPVQQHAPERRAHYSGQAHHGPKARRGLCLLVEKAKIKKKRRRWEMKTGRKQEWELTETGGWVDKILGAGDRALYGYWIWRQRNESWVMSYQPWVMKGCRHTRLRRLTWKLSEVAYLGTIGIKERRNCWKKSRERLEGKRERVCARDRERDGLCAPVLVCVCVSMSSWNNLSSHIFTTRKGDRSEEMFSLSVTTSINYSTQAIWFSLPSLYARMHLCLSICLCMHLCAWQQGGK